MYQTLADIEKDCLIRSMDYAEAIMTADAADSGIDTACERAKMEEMWKAMRSAAENYDGSLKSRSGLVGGEGRKMDEYVAAGKCLAGDFMGRVISTALKLGECNACMKRIVAAPTAGACGVLPAILVPYSCDTPDADIVQALFVAAGIGSVIAENASISGAEGGCQAEIGSAAAMAAGTLVYLRNGTPAQVNDAVGIALSNLMGLVCDPVAGLVEVPCVKRNVIGAMDAVSAAEMALAGISPKIPPDQIIRAMCEVGEDMSRNLKETGAGGLAATPEGIKIKDCLK